MQAAKRRRVELDVRSDYATSDSFAYSQAGGNEQYLRSFSGYGSHHDTGATQPSAFSLDASSLSDVGRAESTEALAAAASTGRQWGDAPPYADAYPGAATFSQLEQQQPYYSGYGQQATDPSTYKSPWPPQTHSEGFGDHDHDYGHSTSNTMPYLGTTDIDVANANESIDGAAATSLQRYGPDMGVSSDYRSYDDRIEEIHAVSLPPERPAAMVFDDASMQLKNQSLPALENLATQLIHTTAKISLPQIQEILNGSETEEGQAYNTLKSLFEQTRKVYSPKTPFIDAIAIQMFQPHQQEIIRKANIATFISSMLGAHDVSFFHLNEFFMETFIPLGHRLLKWQGAIFLDLKTQAYISALINSDGNPSAMLDELFPPDLDAQILTRHPDAPSLSPSEQDFLDRCRARKSYLLAEGNASAALKDLPKKYQWSEFVREFAACISKNVDAILNTPMRTHPSASDRKPTFSSSSNNNTNNDPNPSSTYAVDAPSPPARLPASLTTSSSSTHPPSSSNPTTIRQPWTKPEEDALLSGLSHVQGPHWSQILALFGRGGSVSEVLKDRNQVQLKDKARNLKLWYLKMGRTVPESLRGVTGELKKRGGKGARAVMGEEEEEGVEVEKVGTGGKGDGEGAGGGGAGRRKTKKGS